jgi:ABC-2 type transport system ATP-binding protein
MSASAPAGGAAIVFDGVVKRYGALTALDHVSFEVAPARMFGLIGPDGAGKTTTIRVLCGLLHTDAGTVRVLGHDPVRQHRQVTHAIGYLSQRFSLYGDLSVDENIAFFAEIHGLRDYAGRRQRLLDMTQLAPFRQRLADRLSGGMKQKLALACTLIHEPQVIVLDEPTTGVDPVSRRELWKLLSEFLEAGITIVLSTPYLDEAERCSRVALLHEGRLLALDEPDRLRDALPGRILELVAGDQERAVVAARTVPEIEDVQTFGERIHLRLRGSPDQAAIDTVMDRLRAVVPGVRSVRPVRASLEDVFIARLMAGGETEQAPPAA